MKIENSNNSQLTQPVPAKQASLRVRTGLRAGAWNCANCVGTVNGSQMLNPSCGYCQPA